VDAVAWAVVFMIFVMILIALFWCPPNRARCRSELCFDHAQTTPGAGRAQGTAALTRLRLCCEHWGKDWEGLGASARPQKASKAEIGPHTPAFARKVVC
jgi:hypothetical protein